MDNTNDYQNNRNSYNLQTMKYNFQLVFILFLPYFTVCQTNTFVWEDGLTYYTGRFDTTKYSLDEIETIYHYLHTPNSEVYTVGNVWRIEQMDTATTAAIDKYYEENLKILETMKIPKGVFWDSLLYYRKRELFEVTQQNRLFVMAIKNPSVLNDQYREECAGAIQALNGDSTALLKAWYLLKERQKLNNCCPDNLEKEFQLLMRSKYRLQYARLELMKYDWHNCMNRFVYHHDDYLRIEEEFEKLFVSVEIEEEEE